MKLVVGKNYDEMSALAARQMIEKWNELNVLGLATGSTPIGLYNELVKACENGEISFKDKVTVNLDEYIGLPDGHKESYRFFMNENLFDRVDIDKNNTYVPKAEDENDVEAGKRYEEIVKKLGGADVQILGIGENGHIAFNEPDEELNGNTGIVKLTESTIHANSRFFDSEDEVPRYAISMGMRTILSAKEIILLASGKKKADAVRKLFMDDKITTQCPVTFLKLHPNVTVYIDEDINEEIKKDI